MTGGSDRVATGWRHLYTWARRGSLGAPGFQTVACAEAIDARRLRGLERAVSGLRPPTGRPALFLQPSPSDEARSVLTRSTPTGRSADGRPGGFLAESVVVPDAWLAAAGWNLEAVFRTLPWGGAGSVDEDEVGADPAVLPDEELPAPPPAGAAETRDAVARLDRLLPDPELRAALLETLFWQAEGGGAGETVHVVAAPETPAEDFEALVLLLPLALPPAERVRAVDGRPGESRSLRLGTSAAPGSLPRADLLGVPDALLEEARRAPGLVLDLAERIPWPRPGDAEVRERARRASRDLGGEPAERSPENLHPKTDEASDEPSMDDERTNDEALLTDRDAEPAPDPLAERAAAWRLRESTEAEASALLTRIRQDHERLLEPLRRLVEDERRKLQGDLDGMKQELARIGKEAREELAKEETRQEGLLGEDVERRVKELRKSYQSAVDRLDDLHRDLRDRLSEREAEAEDRLRQASGIPAPRASRKDRRDRPERERLPVERARPDAGLSSGHRKGFWERVRSARTGYQVAAAAAVVLVIAAAAWWLVSWRGGSDETATLGTTTTGGTSGGQVAPGAGFDGGTDGARSAAVERLRRGPVAAAVLAAAAGSESEAVRDRAAAAHLALLLGAPDGAAALDETTSCALLQQVLADRRAAAGLEPIGVDGQCGEGTQSALSQATAATGCSGASWPARAACVMNRTLSAGEPPCAASWPFRRPCGWSDGEAEEALRRVRRMPAALGGPLDLAADPAAASRMSSRTLDPAEAGSLLPLAWAAAEEEAGRAVASVPTAGGLDEGRIETAARYLEGLSGR